MEELTTEERATLDELTERMSDSEFDERTLIRFLKAQYFNLDAAEEMLRATVVWRKENEEKYFGNRLGYEKWEAPPEISTGLDIYFCGKDFEGRPVYYAPLGMWASARDIYEKGFGEDCLRYAGKGIEEVHECLLKTKHQDFVCIVDNAGITYWKAWYEMQNLQGIQDLIRIFMDYEANFPQTLHRALVINTPSVFYWGFNIVKPMMSQQTLSKIDFYSAYEEEWMPALREYLPIESIPKKFGGTSEMKPLWPFDKWIPDMKIELKPKRDSDKNQNSVVDDDEEDEVEKAVQAISLND